MTSSPWFCTETEVDGFDYVGTLGLAAESEAYLHKAWDRFVRRNANNALRFEKFVRGNQILITIRVDHSAARKARELHERAASIKESWSPWQDPSKICNPFREPSRGVVREMEWVKIKQAILAFVQRQLPSRVQAIVVHSA